MIKETFDYILSLLRARIAPMILIFVLMLSTIIVRLFSLQIVNGESYLSVLNESVKKTMSVPAARGRIFDKNGILLAYNDMAFAVKISDSGVYKDNETKNAAVNSAIEKTLNILDEKGDTYTNDFKVEYTPEKGYQYTVSGKSLLRFQRDSFGTATIDALTDEQKNATAEQLIDYECKRYGLNKENYSPKHLIEIIYLRLLMSANSYNRYMAFTISNEVSDETVAAILESSGELVGVTVEEQYIRKYVDSVYCSQILGYTGSISSEEIETLGDSYENNDVIGKSGIEKSMENLLAGKKGSKTVYVDTVGRITEVLDETDSVAGNDVYLTIDLELQKKIYNAIEDEITNIILGSLITSDQKYTYKRNGDIDDIRITIKEMYFSIIDNNVVSLEQIAKGGTDNEASIYNSFLSKQESVSSWLKDDLSVKSTPYGQLSDEYREYVWYIYNDLLCGEGVFDKSKVDSNDSVYQNWNAGDSTSFEQFLKYSISKNWINMSMLATEQYATLEESYKVLVDYIFAEIEEDKDFHKLLYKHMIQNGNISGRQVCMLLFEQGIIDNDSEYEALKRGSLSSYDFMRNALKSKEITPAQLALLPCSGACVITDPNTGDVLALVSYPSYDNNMLSGSVDSDYYNKLNSDKSLPLYNWATQAQSAPGSTFKVCAALAGLDTGLINSSSHKYCKGVYDEVTPHLYCWQRSGHGDETVTTALRDSCNVFFYDIGYRLACSKNGNYDSSYGTSIFQKYADQLGLGSLSGIEIEEKSPNVSDIDSIQSAIGQGNHAYSTVNLARYCTTIANSGTCYNLTLIDKITDNNGNVIKDNSATVANQMTINSTNWGLVQQGMKLVAGTYTALNATGLSIAAKTGTAQENRFEPDHAQTISYAPYENPDIAMAVSIQNGYTSRNTVDLTAEIYKIYYGLK